jgi:hypothetical protein
MLGRISSVLAGLALALAPALSSAELYKCVSANGTTSFSDKPCATKEGEKEVDIKENSAFSSIIARDRDRKIGETCSNLKVRYSQCGQYVNESILQHFHDNCYGPMNRFEVERARAANNNYGEPIDWDHDYRYHRLTTEELKCGVIVTDIWHFVKDNFSKNMTEKEIQSVDYEIQTASPDVQSTPASPRIRRAKRAQTLND